MTTDAATTILGTLCPVCQTIVPTGMSHVCPRVAEEPRVVGAELARRYRAAYNATSGISVEALENGGILALVLRAQAFVKKQLVVETDYTWCRECNHIVADTLPTLTGGHADVCEVKLTEDVLKALGMEVQA